VFGLNSQTFQKASYYIPAH